ncbi:MAG: hypothetical protein P8Y94_13665 [Acidobacteriota bacterium]
MDVRSGESIAKTLAIGPSSSRERGQTVRHNRRGDDHPADDVALIIMKMT